MDATNPRERLGANLPKNADKIDYAKQQTEYLVEEYAGLDATFQRLKAEAAKIPDVINDDDTALAAGGVIKALRDLRTTFENTRKVEGEPDLRRLNATNAHFGSYTEEIQPDDKKTRLNKPGIIDVTQAKINGHQDRKEAAARAKLAAEAAERARIAREAREAEERAAREAQAAQRAAQEAADKASRARTEESRKAREAEAAEAKRKSDEAAAAAKSTSVVAERAAEQSQDARVATLATSADIVRTQGKTAESGGVTLTKATEKFALLVDRGEMNDEAKLLLFEHFTDLEVEKAVRSFANATRHAVELAGCEIGIRKSGVTR